MLNSFFKANLVSLRRVNVLLFTDSTLPNDFSFYLYQNEVNTGKLNIIKKTTVGSLYFFVLELANEFDFSKRNHISNPKFGLHIIDTTNATTFKEFDFLFNYDGGDLGNDYHKDHTDFAVWAPTSPFVQLKLFNEDGSFTVHNMERKEKGVYRLTVNGDLLNKKYHYLVENSGVIRECNDPYAKGTSLNSEHSVVIDLKELDEIEKISPKNPINNAVDSIIYEVSIRDFTENSKTDIVHKGKYLGFIEENRKTTEGHPAGLSYLKYLGVTHVQLLPIIDFRGVDDIDVKPTYNWGYDPIHLFAIEGSYSIDPNTAITRLKEFKTLVSTLHKNDIRVVMDVVYNHMYEHLDRDLEKIVPNYFFRRKKNGEISNASGCGNDFASERFMARKIILDSVKYFFDVFDIDGYRFDLMGLIDGETMLEIDKACLARKKDCLIYGEGWNMTNEITYENRCINDRAKHYPHIGFFNDVFRDILKGSTFDMKEKGYLCGDISYHFGMDYAFHGSILKHSYDPKFLSANQSINYVECHDNSTIYDKLLVSNAEESPEILLLRTKLSNALVMMSFGVPFIHMGQEIALSKFGHHNSYNVPKINNMAWDKVDDNFKMVDYLKMLINLRKNKLPFLHLSQKEDIENIFRVEQWDNGLLCFVSKDHKYLKDDMKQLLIVINPLGKNILFSLDDYYELLNCDGEKLLMKNVNIPPATLYLLCKRD